MLTQPFLSGTIILLPEEFSLIKVFLLGYEMFPCLKSLCCTKLYAENKKTPQKTVGQTTQNSEFVTKVLTKNVRILIKVPVQLNLH